MKIVKLNVYYFRGGGEQASQIFKNVDLNKDYYKLLQLEQDACDNAVKKSYLKLVKKLHPDMNPLGHDLFTEVQQAYHVLSDKKLKKYYDQNNSFYQSFRQTAKSNSTYEDPRNEQFYSKMKGEYYNDFNQKQEEAKRYEEEKRYEEDNQQARQRKKFEEEIELTRKILFTRNPIWQRANAFMNYEERQRRVEQKQKQLEELFPRASKIASSLKKWIF